MYIARRGRLIAESTYDRLDSRSILAWEVTIGLLNRDTRRLGCDG